MVYAIWMEGFRVMEGDGTASLLGHVYAKSFQEACDNWAKTHEDFRQLYDPARLTYWGCKLFDNEEEARRNYG